MSAGRVDFFPLLDRSIRTSEPTFFPVLGERSYQVSSFPPGHNLCVPTIALLVCPSPFPLGALQLISLTPAAASWISSPDCLVAYNTHRVADFSIVSS